MRRFLIFSGDAFYPSGGLDDYDRDASSLDDARRFVKSIEHADWAQIVDTCAADPAEWSPERWVRAKTFDEEGRLSSRDWVMS